jgi:hypothetical protein
MFNTSFAQNNMLSMSTYTKMELLNNWNEKNHVTPAFRVPQNAKSVNSNEVSQTLEQTQADDNFNKFISPFLLIFVAPLLLTAAILMFMSKQQEKEREN